MNQNPAPDEEREWWQDFPRSWRDLVLAGMLIAAFVASLFAPAATCKFSTGPASSTRSEPDRVLIQNGDKT